MGTVRRIALSMTAPTVLALCTACSASVAPPPEAVGDDYPGTCMPPELSWPSDFLESLPGESAAVGGSVVGLRLEYVDSEWMWRIRSADTREDAFGERVDDPSFGRESLVDVRTLEILSTQETELTDAEQQPTGSSAVGAAMSSGEQWPSPLIVEMTRVMEDGTPKWRITTCDTATNEQSVMTLD
ncbi:hypothetical protein IF188_04220 [Microbacterium sp. NEAU-LLC]|uniref:Uncharacterized protein n=1 Tax=Microbacterium helvum TaxID=2773713 RepID=A0ABR8NJR3_9MICO|nr:hypothetical protein [Microbacterium helvum]MBD3940908.1 hypothetical protein [Microbacterium helvum]